MDASFDLFEKQFGMNFPDKPEAKRLNNTNSGTILPYILNNAPLLNNILRLNDLDMKLYDFALDLFLERAQKANIVVNKERVDGELRPKGTSVN